MVFSSVIFLFLFLPVTVGLYFICPTRYRNIILLIASLFFYAWGEPVYIGIMLFSTVFDYANGRLLGRFEKSSVRKLILTISVVGNLGILFFFKYLDFFTTNINNIFGTELGVLGLALPIGISFYTFQTMSYTIDVYRRRVEPQKNIINFATYVCLFPQLIAGPIVRYRTISRQLAERRVTSTGLYHGLYRFMLGLGKKVILANTIGALWEEINGSVGTDDMSVLLAWLGAVCFTMQIYFDFSGYSDMSIGLGKIFGFSFPENFRYPYMSKSITEFWRRWHISMGTWFRDYVYIPLGGNRKGISRQIINLFIVWALTGFWHGASWNYVWWGLYYFVLLLMEKLWLGKLLKKLPAVVGHIYSIVFVVFGWVIFACEDVTVLTGYVNAMFGVGVPAVTGAGIYDLLTYGFVLIALCIAATPLAKHIGMRFRYTRAGKVMTAVLPILVLAVALPLIIRGSYNPFLYFRF